MINYLFCLLPFRHSPPPLPRNFRYFMSSSQWNFRTDVMGFGCIIWLDSTFLVMVCGLLGYMSFLFTCVHIPLVHFAFPINISLDLSDLSIFYAYPLGGGLVSLTGCWDSTNWGRLAPLVLISFQPVA